MGSEMCIRDRRSSYRRVAIPSNVNDYASLLRRLDSSVATSGAAFVLPSAGYFLQASDAIIDADQKARTLREQRSLKYSERDALRVESGQKLRQIRTFAFAVNRTNPERVSDFGFVVIERGLVGISDEQPPVLTDDNGSDGATVRPRILSGGFFADGGQPPEDLQIYIDLNESGCILQGTGSDQGQLVLSSDCVCATFGPDSLHCAYAKENDKDGGHWPLDGHGVDDNGNPYGYPDYTTPPVIGPVMFNPKTDPVTQNCIRNAWNAALMLSLIHI